MAKYTCPMHPEVISNEPGVCPKCNMNLVSDDTEDETNGDHDHSNPSATAHGSVYACPMHPDVTSDKPGMCPKCHMALEKTKRSSHDQHDHHVLFHNHQKYKACVHQNHQSVTTFADDAHRYRVFGLVETVVEFHFLLLSKPGSGGMSKFMM